MLGLSGASEEPSPHEIFFGHKLLLLAAICENLNRYSLQKKKKKSLDLLNLYYSCIYYR